MCASLCAGALRHFRNILMIQLAVPSPNIYVCCNSPGPKPDPIFIHGNALRRACTVHCPIHLSNSTNAVRWPPPRVWNFTKRKNAIGCALLTFSILANTRSYRIGRSIDGGRSFEKRREVFVMSMTSECTSCTWTHVPEAFAFTYRTL